jgi:hypothetical protein
MRWNPFRPKPHRKVHREAWKARALAAERRVAILSAMLGPEKLAELAQAEAEEEARRGSLGAEQQRSILFGITPTAAEPASVGTSIDFGPLFPPAAPAEGIADAKPAE